MNERKVGIPTPHGTMDTFITHPESAGPYPVVIVYMDVWGVREELIEIARRIGSVGYYCVLPDLYYRQGKISFDYRDEKNRVVSVHRLDAETRRLMHEPLQKITNTHVVEDTGAILDFLTTDGQAMAGPIGAVGYCMGGRHVLSVASSFPARFRASASLHGTDLISNRVDSPHLAIADLQGEVYCGFAERDANAPPAMIEELSALLCGAAVRHCFEIHPGTEHGYALPDRDIYDGRATARDWEQIFAMFHRQIPPYGGRHPD